VDMRVAAGEVVATMYELARIRDPDFEGGNIDLLTETLHELATDSQKFRAKKDRKMQKSNFRDILRAVKDGESPDFIVKFTPCEGGLKVSSWTSKIHYDVLCCLLGSGMNHHLAQNPLIRDIFNLGSPLVLSEVSTYKVPKFERHMGNLAADRNRTKALAKVRDKRLDIM